MRRILPISLVVGIALLGTALVACSDDDDDDGGPSPTAAATQAQDDDAAAAIESTLRGVEQAWADGDFEAFRALHTDAGLQAQLADQEGIDTPEGQQEAFEQISAEDQLVIDDIGNIEIDGTSATALVEAYMVSAAGAEYPAVVIAVDVGLLLEDDAWKIDSLEFKAPELTDGVTAIDVDANEFVFTLDAASIADGSIAFSVHNRGAQPHHVVVNKLPSADFDIEAALNAEEEPAGLVHIGAIPPFEPGTSAAVVFTEPLPSGAYALLCFLPDTSEPSGETPHVAKGMWAKFTIP